VGATYKAHGLAQDVDQSLVGDGNGVGEEEEAQGYVEERDGRDDGLCRNERHDGVFGLLVRVADVVASVAICQGPGPRSSTIGRTRGRGLKLKVEAYSRRAVAGG
jgi:hypothetical protein